MGKLYTFALQSTAGLGATSSSKTYYYDWGILPDNKSFKVTFNFMLSSGSAGVSVANTANLFVNLGQNSAVIGSTNQLYKTGFMGSLHNVTDGNRLFAFAIDNAPVWLDRRPNNNMIRVELLSNNIGFPVYAITTAYTLTLTFEEQD